MKDILVTIGVFLMIPGFSQKDITAKNFVLKGEFKGTNTEKIVLGYLNGRGEVINDTSLVKDGHFSFSGFLLEPTLCFLSGSTKSKTMDDPNRNELFIEPGTMTISLAENDFKHAKITGSFTQSQLDSVKAKKEIVFAKLGVRELQAKYETSLSALAKDKDNIQLRDQTRIAYGKLAPYREALRAIDFQFVAEHRNSYLSPYLLRFHLARLPLDSLEGFYSSLDAAIQNSFSGKLVKEQIMRKYGVGIGNSASNFTAKTSNGNFIELASFKSKKYVLLDFWASWCIPCRQHAPDLIMLFKKYHEQGLEIISISTDVNQQDWIQAIKNDKTGSWYHIQADLSEKKRSGEEVEHNRNSNLASKYVVGVLPTKMLISKDGTILVRDEGSDDKTLEQKLLEIFGF